MKIVLLLATLGGLIVAALVIGQVGFADVSKAVLGMGLRGFLIFCLYTFVVSGVLGLAWWVVSPQVPFSASPIFIWGRITREAATDVLPFSQFGGLVVGARTVAAFGFASPLVYSGMIVDITTEMASQAIFTLFGVAALLLSVTGHADHTMIIKLAIAGAGLAVVTLGAFAFFQGPLVGMAGRLCERMLPGSEVAASEVRRSLDKTYRLPGRLTASFLFNLLAWILSGLGAWIALRLMGAEIAPGKVIVIESLIFAVRSSAFMIPGALGLQEGAYLLVAPIFGLDPGLALALSLVKRARDLAIGLPSLIIWQLYEGKSLLFRRRASGTHV